MDVFLTNSLTRKKEKFEPLNPPNIGMYTCGPTVYDFAHIGHGRKYVIDDLLKRALTAQGFKVKHVQNVTDVGHLTSDADEGEDKMEKGAKLVGKTVWEVAEYFTNNFYETMDSLNIIRPDIICKATDHIPEQIEMVKKLVEKGFAYDTPEAVYFDVTKDKDYGKLTGQLLIEKKVAVREDVETGEHKKNPQDFALWFKRVGRFSDHTMHWDSPWGDGFPGWHIECSAMSVKYLGDQFDIHTGGEDHIPVHHTNEIAQSESSTGSEPFVKYWLHTAFLTVDGTKMSKSLKNYYTIADVIEKGFEPAALRYLFLSAHYRDPLNFTWESLQGATNALNNLRRQVQSVKEMNQRNELSAEKSEKMEKIKNDFWKAINDDLNTSKALAVFWDMFKSNIPSPDKYDLALIFDDVLGLGLGKVTEVKEEIPTEIQKLVTVREKLRKEEKYDEADSVRKEIEEKGYVLKDTSTGTVLKKE